MTPTPPFALAFALAFASAGAPGPPSRPAAAPSSTPWQAARLMSRADSLLNSTRPQAGLAFIDSMLRVAREHGDRTLETAALTTRGRGFIFAGRSGPAVADLDSALALATTRRDTLWLERALASHALGLLFEGRLRESTPIYRRVLMLAGRMRDREYLAYAWMGLAYDAVLGGRPREARDGYRRALALGAGRIGIYAEREARIGLGRALTGMRDTDGARAVYRQVLEEARRDGDRVHQGQALNNLGATELVVGDPASAMDDWHQAYEIERVVYGPIRALTPLTNSMVALTQLGRLDEACDTLEHEVEVLGATGSRRARAGVRNQIGFIRRMQGRQDEAERIFRENLAMGDSLTFAERKAAATGFALSLATRGRCAEAVDTLARFESQNASKVLEYPDESFERAFADCLLDLGRPQASLERAVRVSLAEETQGIANGAAALRVAKSWRALGRPDSALVALHTAARQWAAWRGGSSDFGWREARGAAGSTIYSELADLLLGASDRAPTERQARAVFAALQPFKTRTLEERMRGPQALESPASRVRVGVDSLQRSVLLEGELFLDFFASEERSFVIAITRREARAARLPGLRALRAPAARLRDLMMTPPQAADAADASALCDAAGSALGALLFGPVADLVRRSTRVLISADATLGALPLSATLLPGAGPTADPEPLLAGREVVFVPSATLLAELRGRAGRAVAASRKLLVLARTTDPEGRPLNGVDREARWLGASFAGVDVRSRRGEPSVAAVAADLGRFEVLHLAAHTQVDPVLPWRSGVLIGADAPHTNRTVREGDAQHLPTTDPYLRASTIARLHLPARLCVLSGCSSAGTSVLFGEGVQGLASAFLSAGVPTVIATLWPVDDQATAELVERFYRAMGRGASAGAALREAQLAVRAHVATRHPFFWAGFVLVGEPSTRVTLERRS